MQGIFNLNKRPGVTSRDTVNVLQRALRESTGHKVKCGHAGTLDPLASGVLLVCMGQSTRLIPWLQDKPKTYRAGFTLGVTSDTDDSTGQLVTHSGFCPPDRRELEQVLGEFSGEIMQTPPAYSALKVAGRRAYRLARAGETPDLKPRPVRIDAVTLEHYEFPQVQMEIRCGSGTYIRSLARDLGARLGCGGLMHSLDRTAIGPFTTATALHVEEVVMRISECTISELAAFADQRIVRADASILSQLHLGPPVAIAACDDPLIVVATSDDQLLAILEPVPDQPGKWRARLNRVPAMNKPPVESNESR